MEVDIIRRLNALISVLKSIGIINTQGDIAKDLGYKREGTISEIVKGKVPISEKFIVSFCSTYDINEEYIKSGKNPVFKEGSKNEQLLAVSPEKEKVIRELVIADAQIRQSQMMVEIRKQHSEYEPESLRPYASEEGSPYAEVQNSEEYKVLYEARLKEYLWKGVPIFDTPVSAGMLSLIRDESAPEPSYYLPIPSFKDCKFGARVTGDSMYPEIRSGDFVILKEVADFIYGDIYLVVTVDGQETVKRVYPHEEDPNKINLVPSNKEIPVTPILKSNIIKILKVKGVIKGY